MAQNLELDKVFFQSDEDIKQGRIVEAIENLTYIIEQDTEYGKAYNHLGWIYEAKYKDYVKSEECYRLALKYAPEYLPIYLNYSFLLSNLKKWEQLEELLVKAIKVPGINESKIWNEYAIMYEMKGEYENAISANQKAIKLSLSSDDIVLFEKAIKRCRDKQGESEF